LQKYKLIQKGKSNSKQIILMSNFSSQIIINVVIKSLITLK